MLSPHVRPLTPLLLAVAVLVPALPTSVARAHLGSTKYVTVSRTGSGARVVALIETSDVAVGLGLPAGATERDLAGRGRAIGPWVAHGLSILAPEPCAPTPGVPGFTTRDGRRFVVVSVAYRCRDAARLVFQDDTVFDEDPQHETIVHFEGGSREAGVLRRGRQSITLGDVPTIAPTAGRFFGLGMTHFATGYDHVLFLLSLLLPLGTALRNEGRRAALRDALWLVTAFTVGHSLTLALASLGVVVLPSRPVELSIAASIVAVAIHNVRSPSSRGPVRGLAFAFGLLHGFGFSSVLVSAGLPSATLVPALLAFNVGIEFAQVLVIAALAVPIGYAARYSTYERLVVRGGSVVVATLGALVLVERLAS